MKTRELQTLSGQSSGVLANKQVKTESENKRVLVAGAVAEGFAGDKVQQNSLSNTYSDTVPHCRTVSEPQNTS